MARHLITSGLAMTSGLVAVWFVCRRWDRPKTFGRFAVAYGVFLVVIALVSAGSEVYRVRCHDNPNEWCEYNDSVPAMFSLAAGYVLVAWIRAWTINTERG